MTAYGGNAGSHCVSQGTSNYGGMIWFGRSGNEPGLFRQTAGIFGKTCNI